jgi:hypothetical protein
MGRDVQMKDPHIFFKRFQTDLSPLSGSV